MKHYFIRTAPYNYKIKDLSLYQSFHHVASRTTDPDIESGIPLKALTETVYVSAFKRSIQSGLLMTSNVHIQPCLNEIQYNMKEIIDEKDCLSESGIDIKKARKAFVKALIHNQLTESYDHVIDRVKKILTVLNEPTTCFSHGFFMKVVESYIRDPSIEYDSRKLLDYFNGETETFHFSEGFVVEYTSSFRIERYISSREIIKTI